MSLPHVFWPTTPSAASPRDRWKLTTRDFVPLPKIPSVAPLNTAIEVTASTTTTACRTDLAMVMGLTVRTARIHR